MKKQFSILKAAALILCMVFTLGFGGIAADAASGGQTTAAIKEMGARVQASIHRLLSEEDRELANETVTLPIQVYASDLVGINDDYVILANERGLVIYDRRQEEIISVLDLQQMECNYLNANSIATRIFLDDEKLYLFNETGIGREQHKGETASLPESAYIYDLSALSGSSDLSDTGTGNSIQNSNVKLTSDKYIDNNMHLTRTTDKERIEDIYALWLDYSKNNIRDTFDSFSGTVVTDPESEKYDSMTYSRNSLSWTDKSGKKMISCLVVFNDTDYELYTKESDGILVCKKLNLNSIITSPDHTTTENDSSSPEDPVNSEIDTLPTFSYTGGDPVLETICAYMMRSDDNGYYVMDSKKSVYIPAPVIYDTITEGDDLLVFCNLWDYVYYRNGNTLECTSGGEAPARLRLHPKSDASGGYEVIEDLRTGDGSGYTEGIEQFCAGYPGMADKYFFGEESLREEIRTALIHMYVQNNGLDIKYYKDYGWDPVSVK